MKKGLHVLALTALACLVSGCWTKSTDPKVDPYEGFNRGVFNFNRGIDKVLFRPVALVYRHATPPFLQKGVRNAFNNMNELVSIPNDLVQGKVNYSLIDMTRFLINSTIGLLGLFDPASHMGLPEHYNDFGLTFAYYSDSTKSPYLMLPLIGPTTFRNAVAMPLYIISYPPTYFTTAASWSVYALKLISIRADLLDTDKFVNQAFDPYVAVRNAYLQRRNGLVARNNAQKDYDPNHPPEAQASESIETQVGTPIQADQFLGSEEPLPCNDPENNRTCQKITPVKQPETPKQKKERAKHRVM